VSLKLALKITPNAKCSELLGWEEGVLKLKIAAPAVDGKANAELVRFLAATLGVPKSQIVILKGETARNKLLEVPDGAKNRLHALSSSSSSPE
jgi:uncharacterized protein (TIGR00251 family)